MKIVAKNWSEFQHYKQRTPPWIRLHRSLLDDFEYQCLPVASRALAPMLWLLASENLSGEIDATPERLAFRFRMTVADVLDALKPLIERGFFVDASGLLAECLRDAEPETETETEAEAEAEAEAEERPRAKKSRASALEATRLPVDWFPSETDIAFCRTERPDLDPTKVAEAFKDHWKAAPGAKGRKSDWPATWRNWVRNERVRPSAKVNGYSDKHAARADYHAQMARIKETIGATSNVIDITPTTRSLGDPFV